MLSCIVLVGLGLLSGPLMQRLRPSAEEIYSNAPDPVASAAVKQVFEDVGSVCFITSALMDRQSA
jgi:hypothetical protein